MSWFSKNISKIKMRKLDTVSNFYFLKSFWSPLCNSRWNDVKIFSIQTIYLNYIEVEWNELIEIYISVCFRIYRVFLSTCDKIQEVIVYLYDDRMGHFYKQILKFCNFRVFINIPLYYTGMKLAVLILFHIKTLYIVVFTFLSASIGFWKKFKNKKSFKGNKAINLNFIPFNFISKKTIDMKWSEVQYFFERYIIVNDLRIYRYFQALINFVFVLFFSINRYQMLNTKWSINMSTTLSGLLII